MIDDDCDEVTAHRNADAADECVPVNDDRYKAILAQLDEFFAQKKPD